ncbi:MAG TPA: SDR family NAD(P)-dependent oxidoreductase [Candidatus Limnocylindrales bacterium]|nr:SDR family NAD(P)-dependent oxidoreductase [Candidatus Limnocylindrales bacterium]
MDPRSLLDDALEATVVASFSSLGIRIRRTVFGWVDPPDGALIGRTVLITGPTSGLGRAATDELAALGARVVLVGRNEERLAGVRAALVARHGEDRFPMVVADMGSIGSVRDAVAEVIDREARLDVLIDNAGAIHAERTDGPDGIESTLATLVVGPFVLIAGLLPLLRRTEQARVISVTSGGQYAQRLDLDDLQFRRGTYDGTRAYARAKRAQVALVREWARRLRLTGIRVNAMHPGWADTPGLAEALPAFQKLMQPILRSPTEGIDTLIWLATAPGAGGPDGQLYHDRRPRPFDRVPGTRLSANDRRRLWDAVVDLADVPDPAPDRGGPN